MTAIKWIQFILGAAFLLSGLGMFLFEVIGLYHFKYVLNRMHAAAMGDTLGIGLSMIGLIIINGFSMVSLKLLLIVAFLWISSPTSSHLIARLEISTDPNPEKHYREIDLKTLEEQNASKEESADNAGGDEGGTETGEITEEITEENVEVIMEV